MYARTRDSEPEISSSKQEQDWKSFACCKQLVQTSNPASPPDCARHHPIADLRRGNGTMHISSCTCVMNIPATGSEKPVAMPRDARVGLGETPKHSCSDTQKPTSPPASVPVSHLASSSPFPAPCSIAGTELPYRFAI